MVHYDAVLLILGFLLLGKSLEGRARRRALSAPRSLSLSPLRPITARRIVDGVEAVVPLDQKTTGYFDARDALRPDAAEAVAALRPSGLRVLMLTGDSAAAAAPIALAAGIDEVEAAI